MTKLTLSIDQAVIDKAKEIATAKGIADPQKADECLGCHVTGHPVAADQIAEGRRGKATYDITEGVSCEACHGPGSEYKSRKVMQDHEAAVAAGMVVPDEALCVTCHNDKSPTYKPFKFDEFVAKIAHPKPEPAE